MPGDYLSEFIQKCNADNTQNDLVMNLLLKYIITTNPDLSETSRNYYKTLQLLINGQTDSKELDSNAVAVIREAYQDFMADIATEDIDVESIKSMLNHKAFDDP